MLPRSSSDGTSSYRPMPTPANNNTNILLIASGIERGLLIQGELQQMGYRVYLSTDGLFGWRRAYSHTPQLVLLDRELPTISGAQVLARLKCEPATAHIPVVMLGAADSTDSHGADSRADAYLAYDYTFDQLRTVVKQVLAAGRLQAA